MIEEQPRAAAPHPRRFPIARTPHAIDADPPVRASLPTTIPSIPRRIPRGADAASRNAARLADGWAGLPTGVTRWRLAAALRTAAPLLSLTASMLRLLEHYIDLTYDQDWAPDSEPIICRPLIETAEALRLSERQVRNLERALVERGLLVFRDSGNQHRRGRRDYRNGRLLYGYGPSLAPLGARAPEVLALQQQARAHLAETRRLRLAISALRRTLQAELTHAETNGVEAQEIRAALTGSAARTPTGASTTTLAAIRDKLAQLAVIAAERAATRQDEPAATAEPETHCRHTPDTFSENVINDSTVRLSKLQSRSDFGLSAITLKDATAVAGPLIMSAARTPSPSWRALVDGAAEVACLLGIKQESWGQACATLGREGAAMAMIIIERGLHPESDRKSEPIRRPDAYCQGMIKKAMRNALHLDKSIQALLRRESNSRRTWARERR